MKRFLFVSTLACLAGALSAQTSCPNPYDGNGDGAVTIGDLLDLLGLFGDTDTDQDGIWDSVDACVDVSACNYAADPTEGCAFTDALGDCGGGCEGDGDGDGICDDVDTCVGELDECGVCNGPGPTEVVIEDITILYDSVYAEQIDQWFVFELGADTTFSYECTPSFSSCGDQVSYQGYDYATVLIGEQCWFAENLRNENYQNGDPIPSNLSASEWQGTTFGSQIGAVTLYGEGIIDCYNYSPDGNACNSGFSLNEYGRLYNWYAVDDARGLCPSGWHVPTDGEWTVLTDFLGGTGVAGDKMKTTYGWYGGHNGTNSSGFSGLPGGYRSAMPGASFASAGQRGYFWTSTPEDGTKILAWCRSLDHFYPLNRIDERGGRGHSIRCIQDSE